MNDNKSTAELKTSFTVVNQDSHFATSSLPLQPSTPEHVVFLIGQGFNLDDKGDRFKCWKYPMAMPFLRWLRERKGGDHETFHYR